MNMACTVVILLVQLDILQMELTDVLISTNVPLPPLVLETPRAPTPLEITVVPVTQISPEILTPAEAVS